VVDMWSLNMDMHFWRHQISQLTHSSWIWFQIEPNFWSDNQQAKFCWLSQFKALFPRVHSGGYVIPEHLHAFWKHWISLVICSAWTWFQIEPNFWSQILLIFAI
jgi:hypothetical protein